MWKGNLFGFPTVYTYPQHLSVVTSSLQQKGLSQCSPSLSNVSNPSCSDIYFNFTSDFHLSFLQPHLVPLISKSPGNTPFQDLCSFSFIPTISPLRSYQRKRETKYRKRASQRGPGSKYPLGWLAGSCDLPGYLSLPPCLRTQFTRSNMEGREE